MNKTGVTKERNITRYDDRVMKKRQTKKSGEATSKMDRTHYRTGNEKSRS